MECAFFTNIPMSLVCNKRHTEFFFFFLRLFDKRHTVEDFFCLHGTWTWAFSHAIFHDLLFKSTWCFQSRCEHACFCHIDYPGWCFWVKFGHQVQRAHKQNTCKKNAQQEHILRRAPYHACTCATRLCVWISDHSLKQMLVSWAFFFNIQASDPGYLTPEVIRSFKVSRGFKHWRPTCVIYWSSQECDRNAEKSSIRSSTHPSIHPSICPPIHPSIHPSIHVCPRRPKLILDRAPTLRLMMKTWRMRFV